MSQEPAAEKSAAQAAIELYARVLAEKVEAALAPWVSRMVERRVIAWSGRFPAEAAEAARRAGEEAAAAVGPQIRRLLEADIDEQWTTPLELVRSAVRYPTAVLARLGVPPGSRDHFDIGRFPEDLYGLAPASWADVDPDLVEPAIRWGAAKAFEYRRRHGEGAKGRR